MRALITGSTGHIGSNLTLALLRRGIDVVALARSRGEAGAAARVRESLERASENPTLEYPGHLTVIEQDLTEPLGAASTARLDELGIGAIWHCAASTDLNPRRRFSMDHVNVQSTARIAELALRLEVPRMFYVGTAYQCGITPDLVREVPTPARPVSFRNAYEQSKWVGERHLWEELGPRLTVFRPSIVLDQVNAQRISACAWQGFYAYVRKAHQIILRHRLGASPGEPGRLVGRAETRLDLVFVDRVVEAMVRIGLDARSGGVYHLTAREPVSLGQLRDDLEALTGCRIELRSSLPRAAKLSPIQAAVEPYLRHGTRFERERVDALFEQQSHSPPRVTRADVRRHIGLAIGIAESARDVG